MMLSSLLMLVLSIVLYNIFCEVSSAGVPYEYLVEKSSVLSENNVLPAKAPLEYLNNFDYKIEAMHQIMSKMDISLQSLQEKSQTWAIFQHHINSWNEGIRILENKLELLKKTHEEQNQQMQKLEFLITGRNNINAQPDLLENVKQAFNVESKKKDDMFSQIIKILKQIQLTTVCNERKSSKRADIMTPIGAVGAAKPCQGTNNSNNKIEQRLNTLSHQVALQKDIKQLNSLEKRNSKSLENINLALRNQLGKFEDIVLSVHKSNECCHSVSNELTTFTESSDTLLKRIEELVRSVSYKLNDIEVKEKVCEQNGDDNEDIGNESEETEIDEKLSNHDSAEVDEQKELEQEILSSHVDNTGFGTNVTEIFDYDDSPGVEFLRPNLRGCHELPTDESARIDHIYKFSQPRRNEINRDFNERFCIFPQMYNDSGVPWTLIQRRGPYQQQENFNRSWSEYRNGFGHLSRDFWFGNEFIHSLVYRHDYELRIELEDFDGTQMWAEYSVFRLDSEKYNYNLLIGGHRGTIGDAMKYHNDNDFSTYDKRNDKTIDACCSCALGYASGWWFDNCSEANLNGIYHNTPLGHNYVGIMWELWRGDYSLKKTRMMIRPHSKDIDHYIEDSDDFHEFTEDP